MDIPHFGIYGLFSVIGDYKESCQEHLCSSFCVNKTFSLIVEWLGLMMGVCLTLYEVAKLFSILAVPPAVFYLEF